MYLSFDALSFPKPTGSTSKNHADRGAFGEARGSLGLGGVATFGSPVKKQAPLSGVAGECCCAFEFGAGFGESSQFFEQIAPDTGEEAVGFQRWFGQETVDYLNGFVGTRCH